MNNRNRKKKKKKKKKKIANSRITDYHKSNYEDLNISNFWISVLRFLDINYFIWNTLNRIMCIKYSGSIMDIQKLDLWTSKHSINGYLKTKWISKICLSF